MKKLRRRLGLDLHGDVLRDNGRHTSRAHRNRDVCNHLHPSHLIQKVDEDDDEENPKRQQAQVNT